MKIVWILCSWKNQIFLAIKLYFTLFNNHFIQHKFTQASIDNIWLQIYLYKFSKTLKIHFLIPCVSNSLPPGRQKWRIDLDHVRRLQLFSTQTREASTSYLPSWFFLNRFQSTINYHIYSILNILTTAYQSPF